MLSRTSTPLRRVARGQPRLAIIAARYNPALVDPLLEQARHTLARAGVTRVTIERVPGSYEIPVVAMRLACSRKFDVLIALGVILQGQTAHADHIAQA